MLNYMWIKVLKNKNSINKWIILKVKLLSKILFLRGKDIFTFTPERVLEIIKLEHNFLQKLVSHQVTINRAGEWEHLNFS